MKICDYHVVTCCNILVKLKNGLLGCKSGCDLVRYYICYYVSILFVNLLTNRFDIFLGSSLVLRGEYFL